MRKGVSPPKRTLKSTRMPIQELSSENRFFSRLLYQQILCQTKRRYSGLGGKAMKPGDEALQSRQPLEFTEA
jgi:hypothetical protein